MKVDDLQTPIASLQPYDGNPRRGDTALIRDSLERNGQYRPIVVRAETNEVLAGNHTLKAAQELGWTEIAATFVEADDEQAKRIVLIDNRANDVAGYDPEALVNILRSLEDDLGGTGFDDAALRDVLNEIDEEPAEGLTDPDDVPALPAEPRSRLGERWTLGPHRLVCGDATRSSAVEAAVDGEQMHALWTDPPYNVNYEGGTGMTIQNDDLDAGDFFELLRDALELAQGVTAAGGPAYVAHATTATAEVQRAMIEAGWLHKQALIWVKSTFVIGRQDYQWQHEPILYGWKPGAAHCWYGAFDKGTLIDDEVDLRELDKRELKALVEQMRNERNTTVIREDKPSRSELHPTTKPTALIEHCLKNSTQRGDRVLDSFAGSGSTLIAAERLGRIAHLVELDPRYCDVVVARWEQHTGKEAKRADAVEAHA